MDIKSNKGCPVLADPAPINKSRLGMRSSLLNYQPAGSTFSSNNVLVIPKKKSGMLDDVRDNGWLDSMKASSPPRKKILKDHFNVDAAASDDGSDVVYNSWMLKYPSALNSFEKITSHAKNKKIVVFLDYDGTLTPIVDDPDLAFLSPDMRSAVRNVAKYFPTAIISGRRREKVYEFVGLTDLYYAGSHGMDITFPVKETVSTTNQINFTESTDKQEDISLFQSARDFLPVIDEVYRIIVQNTQDINGAKVENHKFCASVHYRNVEEKDWPLIAQCVYDILEDYPRLRLTHGRKVLEIRPVIDWDKGKAVQFLLQSLGLNSKGDVLPIFIGDDRTDEDAFKVLREGNQGYGIVVSSVPKESQAFFSLRDTSEVKDFLKSLVRWKERP